MTGAWNVIQLQTPSQMAWDATNGLQGGNDFAATNGSLILNANGTLSGNLNGGFTGGFQVGSNGLVSLATVASGQTNMHTLFVNAGRSTMSLVENESDTNGTGQQITFFERVPASFLSSDVLGPWNVVQLQTPGQMSWDAINGLQGGGNFSSTNGSISFNASGTISGNLAGAFTGTYSLSSPATVKLTVVAGGATNHFTLFLNANKDALTGVSSQFDGTHNDQQILRLQRPPAN